MLIVHEEEPFDVSKYPDLVESEIEQKKVAFTQMQLNEFKLRKSLANQVAKLAFELD